MFMPVFCSSAVALLAGVVFVASWMGPSLLRVAMTTIVVNLTFIPLVWVFVFDDAERNLVREKIMTKLNLNLQRLG